MRVMNRHHMLALFLSALPVLSGWAVLEKDFSRYDVILQRKPFGVAPPPSAGGPGGGAPAVPVGPPFTQNLRLCGLTETEAGIRAGFVDLVAKPPRSFFLYPGERDGDIELVEAEFEKERAKLRKGAEELWIGMGSDSGSGAPSPAAPRAPMGNAAAGIPPVVAPPVPAAPAGANVSPAGAAPATAAPSVAAIRRMSYAERLRHRREAEAAEARKAQEAPQRPVEELEKQLQDYNMKLIRSGKPPLPIPLTPEQDEQLVKEGVLDPQE